jgi:hypothetical protein
MSGCKLFSLCFLHCNLVQLSNYFRVEQIGTCKNKVCVSNTVSVLNNREEMMCLFFFLIAFPYFILPPSFTL